MKAPKTRPTEVVATRKKTATREPVVEYAPESVTVRKLYVHIKDPDDDTRLMQLKEVCAKHPGSSDIVLVLGETKKSAIRLPFKVDDTDKLVTELAAKLGNEAVVVK